MQRLRIHGALPPLHCAPSCLVSQLITERILPLILITCFLIDKECGIFVVVSEREDISMNSILRFYGIQRFITVLTSIHQFLGPL
jgi:hypothetical protein